MNHYNHLTTNERENLLFLTAKGYSIRKIAAGFMVERRGRGSKGRPRKKPSDKEVENDLIAENQRLREQNQYLEAELEYIKKLSALVLAEEQEKNKKQ